MNLLEQIYESFFQELDKEEIIPKSVKDEIRSLQERKENLSEEKMIQIIKRGFEDESKDKKD